MCRPATRGAASDMDAAVIVLDETLPRCQRARPGQSRIAGSIRFCPGRRETRALIPATPGSSIHWGSAAQKKEPRQFVPVEALRPRSSESTNGQPGFKGPALDCVKATWYQVTRSFGSFPMGVRRTLRRKLAKGQTVLRRFFTSRSGKKIDAWDYGHRCWPIGKSTR